MCINLQTFVIQHLGDNNDHQHVFRSTLFETATTIATIANMTFKHNIGKTEKLKKEKIKRPKTF